MTKCLNRPGWPPEQKGGLTAAAVPFGDDKRFSFVVCRLNENTKCSGRRGVTSGGEEAGKTLAQTSRARGSPSIGWPGSLLVVLSLVESWSIARRLGVLPAIKPRPPDATNRILLGVSGATKRTAQPHHGAQKVAHDRRREKSNKDANEPPQSIWSSSCFSDSTVQ